MERKGGRAAKTGVGETESRGSPKAERLFFILDGARETDPGDSELPVRGAPSARPHFGHVVDGGVTRPFPAAPTCISEAPAQLHQNGCVCVCVRFVGSDFRKRRETRLAATTDVPSPRTHTPFATTWSRGSVKQAATQGAERKASPRAVPEQLSSPGLSQTPSSSKQKPPFFLLQ